MSVNMVTIVRRRVSRVSAEDGSPDTFQVFEQELNGLWKPVSKEYPHSTSAFAALGRLVQKDMVKE